jgi:ABC-2 type transport system permease protein
MCFRRDLGVLKRLRGTPLPPWAFLAGNIGSSLVASVLLVILTTAVGALVYDVPLPAHWGALALTLAAGAFCFCARGFAVTVVIPTAHAAPAVVNGALFPLLFISGTFFPLDPSSVLARISSYFPVGHFQHAILAAFDPLSRGSGIDAADLGVLVAWGIGALLIALRYFRWEPRYH